MKAALVPLLTLAALAGNIVSAQPIRELPYSPSLDTTSIDTAVNACDDFYRYSRGNWIKKNPIPPDQASWN
ncbi:MAG: M13 family peptidase, partial [Acidobacteriota bacterium]|nr:M13 family peptidase [Acidobacteriota bacterium]